MSNEKHTPGPWHVEDGQSIYAKDGACVRLIAKCHAGHREERDANARLIAAAPDLLYAANWALERLEEIHGESNPVVAQLRAAIDKAEGK